jgi:hypothetical protein
MTHVRLVGEEEAMGWPLSRTTPEEAMRASESRLSAEAVAAALEEEEAAAAPAAGPSPHSALVDASA